MKQIKEDLLSIRNSVDIAILVIDSKKENLLATSLEEIIVKAQALTEYCIVKKLKVEQIDKE